MKTLIIITIILFGGVIYLWLHTPLFKEYQEQAEVKATSYIVNNPYYLHENDFEKRYLSSVAGEIPEVLLEKYTARLEETVETEKSDNNKFSTLKLLDKLQVYLYIGSALIITYFVITTIRSSRNEKRVDNKNNT